MSSGLGQHEKNNEYYLPGADLHLLVDNVLFRVHSFFFLRDSSKFKSILSAPIPPNQTRAGSSDSPIIIKNTSPTEFSTFLWVIYNRTYSDYSTTTATEWTSVLKIACENRFCEMQHCAIRGLEGCHLTTVHRIKLYELYKVAPKFLAPLYVEMAMRDAAPSEEDTTDLGDKTVLRIFRLREALRSRRTTNISPLPAGVDEHEATRVVCAFFDIDPAAISLPGAHVTFPSGTPCPISLTSQLKPQARTRTHTLTTLKMGASSINQGSREAFIYGDNFFLGLEGHGMPTPAGNVTKALDIESSTLTTSNLASEAVDIAHKTIPRQFEAEKEVVGSFTSESGSHHMSDDSSNVFVNFLVVFDTIQNTAIPLVPQLARARADLVFFSTFWTLVLFWAVSNMSS